MSSDETRNMRTKIFEAIGAASMCWDPKPSDQVFDSDKAKEIAEDLQVEVVALIREAVADFDIEGDSHDIPTDSAEREEWVDEWLKEQGLPDE